MTIYIDNKNHVYGTPGDSRTAVETTVFDGMAVSVAECYCYYPAKNDHVEFVQAWAPAEEIARRVMAAELSAVSAQNAEYEAALSEIEEALNV